MTGKPQRLEGGNLSDLGLGHDPLPATAIGSRGSGRGTRCEVPAKGDSKLAHCPPPAIPDHKLVRPIGRGSYGVVWLARNVMGALRAVKVVDRCQFDSARPYEREFAGIKRYEPVSRLADGLVHVLHVGRNDEGGYFYYVMELADSCHGDAVANIPGESPTEEAGIEHAASYEPRTLRSDLSRQARLPVADCLEVALDVVNGLVRLHEHGLVHRDVKPGNIIYVGGRAKLADIGLVSTGNEGRTFVGTEGYIPPEGPGSPSSDIYALGMALYEALTGYSPDRFPMAPPEWFRDDASTEAIEFYEVLLKACEGSKERRYQNAREMQADLALLQSGQSIRRMRMLEKIATRVRRLAWAAGIIVALALTTNFTANWRMRLAERMRDRESALLLEARHARRQEAAARALAEGAEREARRQLSVGLSEQAHALVLSREVGHRTRALEALRRAVEATNKADLRRVAFGALSLPDLRLERQIAVGQATTLMQPDPSFQRIALGRGSGPVTLCSLPNLEVLGTLPASTNSNTYSALWDKDGRWLAVKRQHDASGFRSTWEVWDAGGVRLIITTGPDVSHRCVSFHPSEPRLLSGHEGGAMTEWDLQTGQVLRTFRVPDTPHALAYSPQGNRLAVCHWMENQWVAVFYSVPDLQLLRSVPLPESVETLTWDPEGRWVTCTSARRSRWARGVRLIEANTGRITLLGQHKIKTAISEFNADGDHLVTSGWDREVICWDLRTLDRAFTYAGPAYRHTWSGDGRTCALTLPDNSLQFYAFERPECRELPGPHGESLRQGRFSSDGRWLVARDERGLCVWDLHNRGPAAVVPTPGRAAAFFAPGLREVFAVPDEYTREGFVLRWRVEPSATTNTPPQLEPLPVEYPKGVLRADMAGDELLMTSAEGVQCVALTNLATGLARTVRMPGGLGFVSPDARWLAMVYDYSHVVGIYKLPTVEEVARLETDHFVESVTFSPTADELLVLNRAGAEWFETENWQRTRRLPGAPVSGSYAFYTPDGTGIWMVTHFRNAAMLDRRTLAPLLPLPNDVLPLAISPDGRQLAVGVEGRRVQLWDMGTLRRHLALLGLDW